jgi:hypothetical protein
MERRWRPRKGMSRIIPLELYYSLNRRTAIVATEIAVRLCGLSLLLLLDASYISSLLLTRGYRTIVRPSDPTFWGLIQTKLSILFHDERLAMQMTQNLTPQAAAFANVAFRETLPLYRCCCGG